MLSLGVVSQQGDEVTLAVDYNANGASLPRIVDIRLQSSHPATPMRAVIGEALTAAGKELYRDPVTGDSWRQLGASTWGLLGISLANTNSLQTGRIAEVTFDLGRSSHQGSVAFRLIKRQGTFAPALADMALQSEPYDSAVLVER